MPEYIALLGGINLGKRRVKMDILAQLFEALGFKEVATFIASGNVLFATRSTDAAALESRIEQHLERSLGYPVRTFLRTRAEMAGIAQTRPFPAASTDLEPSLYVGFLKLLPPEATVQAVESLRTERDSFRIRGREMFWQVAGKLTGSLVKNSALEKALATPCTLRNITTVRKLATLYPPRAR